MRRLQATFFIIAVILLAATLGVAAAFTSMLKNESAETLVRSTREALLIRDFRSAIMILSKNVPDLFSDIQYRSASAPDVDFSIPDGVRRSIWKVGFSINLYQDDNRQVSFGEVRFYYDFRSYAAYALFIYLLQLAVLFGIFRREFVMIEKEIFLKIKDENILAREAVAKQVAHDIRSPLSSLNIIAGKAVGLSDSEKDIIRSISQRINSIAEDLLKKNRVTQFNEAEVESTIFSFNKSIELVIGEKRELAPDIEFKLHLEKELSGIMSKDDFERIFSNIVNNAIESIESRRVIEVSLFSKNGMTNVTVTDYGKGIPSHILSKLGREVISTKGSSGNGLGLRDANRRISLQGGSLEFISKEGVGTMVIIKIPSKFD